MNTFVRMDIRTYVKGGYKESSDLFNFLTIKLCFFFLYLNSERKMYPFEVCVYVAQKFKKLEGGI